MSGLARLLAAGAASLIRLGARVPLGCGARLLGWSAWLEARARPGGRMPEP